MLLTLPSPPSPRTTPPASPATQCNPHPISTSPVKGRPRVAIVGQMGSNFGGEPPRVRPTARYVVPIGGNFDKRDSRLTLNSGVG